MNHPRIGIDARMYSTAFTGIGQYVAQLLKHLLEEKDGPTYVIFTGPEHAEQLKEQHPHAQIQCTSASHYSFDEQTAFLKCINDANVDLMHFTHFNAPLLYRGASVVTIHDLILSIFPGKTKTSPIHRLAYQMTIRRTVKRASKVIAVSHSTKNDLQTFLNTPEEKVTVIHEAVSEKFRNDVSKEEISRITSKYELPNRYFLYVANWRNHKNIPNLVRAFHILREKFGVKDIDLVITGKEDKSYTDARDTIEDLGVDEWVHAPGFVDDVDMPGLYCGAHAIVFPSLYEGFGLPCLEAMKSGVPLIASNTSSIPEVCGERAARFFDPLNVHDIAEKMQQVCLDESLRTTLIEEGLKRCETFSWKKMAAETKAVYQEALKGSFVGTSSRS